MARIYDYQKAIMSVLAAAGVDYEVQHGRHKMVQFYGRTNRRRYKTVLSCTASDWRSAKNGASALRHMLRSAGYSL